MKNDEIEEKLAETKDENELNELLAQLQEAGEEDCESCKI